MLILEWHLQTQNLTLGFKILSWDKHPSSVPKGEEEAQNEKAIHLIITQMNRNARCCAGWFDAKSPLPCLKLIHHFCPQLFVYSVQGLCFLLYMHPMSCLCQTSWNKLPNGLWANFLFLLWILRSIKNFPWTTVSSFQLCWGKVSSSLLEYVSPRAQEQRAIVRPPMFATPLATRFREKIMGLGVRKIEFKSEFCYLLTLSAT